MCASNGDAIFHAHQLGEHFSTWNHWNVLGAGGQHFDIVRLHSRRKHHDIRLLHMRRSVPLVHCGPLLLQPFGDVGERPDQNQSRCIPD